MIMKIKKDKISESKLKLEEIEAQILEAEEMIKYPDHFGGGAGVYERQAILLSDLRDKKMKLLLEIQNESIAKTTRHQSKATWLSAISAFFSAIAAIFIAFHHFFKW